MSANIVEISTFDEHESFINNNPKCIIFFGSHRCPHCVSAKPLIEDLARKHPQVKFAHVEVSQVKTENITGVPAFVGYNNGQPIDVVLGASPNSLSQLTNKVM